MNAEIKAEWIKRLRDPNALQLTGHLEDPTTNARCCLGVLSDYAVECGTVRRGQTVSSPSNPAATLFISTKTDSHFAERSRSYLVDSITDWAELDRTGILPFSDRQGERMHLSGLNDSGFTFSQIADLIEHFL